MLVRVIEDHPDIAELLRLELGAAGFDVDVRSHNFAELLDPAEWVNVDAAIFDLMLGDEHINGGDLVLFVAASTPTVRRIILTASGDAMPAEVRAAADLVLDKPTGIGKLTEAILGAH